MVSSLRRLVPWMALAAGTLVVAVGLRLDRTGTMLHVPNPPFLWRYEPRLDSWVAVAAVVLLMAAVGGPRLKVARVGPGVFALAALALTAGVRLAESAARSGTSGWYQVFDRTRSFEGDNEYLPALPALRYGVDIFLDRFSEVVTSLPVHAAGHPPGLLLLVDRLAIGTPKALAALCIGAGALATPMLYLLARRLLDDEGAARSAALLLALSPGVTMFGVTSADAVYMTLGVLAALALVAGPRLVGATVGALTLAAASFFAWSLLAVGAWAAVLRLRRDGLKSALVLAAGCGVGLVAFYAVLYAAYGFDPLGTLRGTEQVYRDGIARGRPYSFWLFGSPVAFLVTVGLPITWYAFRALGDGRSVAVAIFAVLGIATVLGFTKAETERIWLFFAPFVCLAAASALPNRRLPLALGLLAAQGLVSELLYDSVW